MARPRRTWGAALSGLRKPQSGDWLWQDARLIVLHRAHDRCESCGKAGEECGGLSMHHIRPFRLGGATTIDNLIALCHKCHMAEHARMRREGTSPPLDTLARRREHIAQVCQEAERDWLRREAESPAPKRPRRKAAAS